MKEEVKETILKHKDLTDEEVYQSLKRLDYEETNLLKSWEWKERRLKELKRTGKVWSSGKSETE